MSVYDILYITNLPSFYKINLFNEIAKYRKLLVIFTHTSSSMRNADFYKGERHFNYYQIKDEAKVGKAFILLKLVICTKYKRLFLAGWDQFPFWLLVLISSKRKNNAVIESSIFESSTSGLKGIMKKFFLRRVSRAYVSGSTQEQLVKGLSFEGRIIKTYGVGIFNIIPQPPYTKKSTINKFIYVGRLSPEKNLEALIRTFNSMPQLQLGIVGFGPQKAYLETLADKNISFLGAIPNKEMASVFQKYDVLILPSISEPWGLVVEEALNNGLPVIVSDRVGCSEDIVNEHIGIVFRLIDPDGLRNAILKMCDLSYHNTCRYYISKLDFKSKEELQLGSYLMD